MLDKPLPEPSPDPTTAYHPPAVETRWQAAWGELDTFSAPPAGDDRTDVHVHVGACSLAHPANLAEVRRHTIADSYARFRRMRGDAVLLSLGFEAGRPAESAGTPPARIPADDAEKAREQRQKELRRLGLSFDWSRSITDVDPAADRWSQRMFLSLLDAGLVHRGERPLDWCGSCRTLLPGSGDQAGQCRFCQGPIERMPGGQWYMRLDPYAEENADLDELAQGDGAMGDAHDRLLGRVEGVELEVQAFDGTSLVAFTPFPKAIGETEFVALSPDHPELERWMQEPEARQRLSKLRAGQSDSRGKDLEYPTLMDSGLWAQVPGKDDLLPLIVSLAVDARFGATAALGIPSTDPIDKQLAEHLPPPPTLRMRSQAKQSQARPASRLRARDLPISSSERQGAAIPVVRCGSCGTVPAPLDALPLPSTADHACPKCGEPAQQEQGTLDPRLAAWAEMLATVPSGDRMEAGFEHPELRRWLAITTTLHDAGAANAMLSSRALMKALRDLDTIDPAPSEGQWGRDLLTGGIDADPHDAAGATDDAVAPHALAEQVGADAVRFALLYAAAPSKSLSSGELAPVLRLSESFLAHLWSYAEPRLAAGDSSEEAAIDASTRLRRRLTAWCDVALRKVTENFAELKMHRAARNVMILLERIEDFEQRSRTADNDPSAEDVHAVRSALLLLVTLLAPIAPHMCDELWGRAGGASSIGEAPWPARTRREDARGAAVAEAE